MINSQVELPASVIRLCEAKIARRSARYQLRSLGNVCAVPTHQDNSGHSMLGGNLGIFQTLNPLDENRQLGVLPDKVDIIPDEVIILISRDGLRDPSRLGWFLPARSLFFSRRRWGGRDSLGSLIESTFRSRSSIDGEHDPVASEVVDFFKKTFRGSSVFVEVELWGFEVSPQSIISMPEVYCRTGREPPGLTWKIKLCP